MWRSSRAHMNNWNDFCHSRDRLWHWWQLLGAPLRTQRAKTGLLLDLVELLLKLKEIQVFFIYVFFILLSIFWTSMWLEHGEVGEVQVIQWKGTYILKSYSEVNWHLHSWTMEGCTFTHWWATTTAAFKNPSLFLSISANDEWKLHF